MAINYLNSVDLNKNYINNAAIQNLAAEPTADTPGQIYFNTVSQTLRITEEILPATNPKTYQWVSVSGDITALIAGTDIDITDETGPTPTINHADITRSDTTSTAAPAYGGTFTAVDTITTSATGHITAVNLKTVTIPASDDTTYDLASAANATAGVDIILTGSDSSTDTVNIIGTGDEVEIAQTATANQLQIGLPDDVIISNNLSVDGDFLVENAGEIRGATTLDNTLAVTLTSTFTGLVTASAGVAITTGSLTAGANTTIDLGANRVTNIADPTSDQDAATKSYVDTAVTGLLQFIGGFDADTGTIDGGTTNLTKNDQPNAGDETVAIAVGDYYVVTADGNFFGNAATPLTVGDSVIVQTAAAAGASTEADFIVVQSDTDLATATTVGLGNVVPGTSATVTAPYTNGTAAIDVVDSTASQKGAVIVAQSTDGNLEGIDLSYSSGTASVGLDIQGLTEDDGTGDPIINFYVPFFNSPDDQNKKITLAQIASLIQTNNSKTGTITAGQLSGTVTHAFGVNTIVQTLDSSGDTVYCDISRTATTSVATISAVQATDITILVQKIG